MERLFSTAHYVAKESLAFKKFKGLCDLQERSGLDVGNNYRNEMKFKEFVSSIAAIEQKKYAKEIRDARFLCVLADAATDKSVTEHLTVFVFQMGYHRHSFLTLSPFSLPMLVV